MSLTKTRGRLWREALLDYAAKVDKADREARRPAMKFDKEGRLIRPMVQFDPAQPAILHDTLNEKWVSYDPARHEANYREYAREHEPGVWNWDGLLIDGWRPTKD